MIEKETEKEIWICRRACLPFRSGEPVEVYRSRIMLFDRKLDRYSPGYEICHVGGSLTFGFLRSDLDRSFRRFTA